MKKNVFLRLSSLCMSFEFMIHDFHIYMKLILPQNRVISSNRGSDRRVIRKIPASERHYIRVCDWRVLNAQLILM